MGGGSSLKSCRRAVPLSSCPAIPGLRPAPPHPTPTCCPPSLGLTLPCSAPSPQSGPSQRSSFISRAWAGNRRAQQCAQRVQRHPGNRSRKAGSGPVRAQVRGPGLLGGLSRAEAAYPRPPTWSGWWKGGAGPSPGHTLLFQPWGSKQTLNGGIQIVGRVLALRVVTQSSSSDTSEGLLRTTRSGPRALLSEYP